MCMGARDHVQTVSTRISVLCLLLHGNDENLNEAFSLIKVRGYVPLICKFNINLIHLRQIPNGNIYRISSLIIGTHGLLYK